MKIIVFFTKNELFPRQLLHGKLARNCLNEVLDLFLIKRLINEFYLQTGRFIEIDVEFNVLIKMWNVKLGCNRQVSSCCNKLNPVMNGLKAVLIKRLINKK